MPCDLAILTCRLTAASSLCRLVDVLILSSGLLIVDIVP